jgi:hypothetical protein
MRTYATAMLLVLAAAAAAQTAQIYKSVDKEGNVTYSEEPPPGVEAQPITVDTHPTPQRRQEAEDVRSRMLQEGQEVDRRLAQERQRRETLQIELERAQQALADARRELDTGLEPLPGERIGTVSGKSRLREEYFARIEKLKDAVKAAERQVQDAQDALAKTY